MGRRVMLGAVAVTGLAGGILWTTVQRGGAAEIEVESVVAPAAGEGDRDRQIQLYQARAEADPWSAGDRSALALLYMRRARETGSHEDVIRAEEMARESLRVRPERNADTWAVLAAALLEQHRFLEAREAAEKLVEATPETPAYRAYLAEINLELGDYRAAGELFRSLEPAAENLDVAPRLARWLEINGRNDQARGLLYGALERARGTANLPAEQLAWFHLRVGDLELRNGRLDEAEEAFQAGLRVFPDDFRILAAMARLEAARRRWPEAIRTGERVIGKQLDPGTLGLMSEVFRASGEAEKAAEYAQVMQVAIDGQRTGFHREWGLFSLDHQLGVREVLEQARHEVKTRRDVYGYDLLAWALLKNGEVPAARQAMARALRLGTKDALLHFHAGMIERAAGNDSAAEKYLEESLRIAPRFHPLHAGEAEAALKGIRASRPWYVRLGSVLRG